MPTAGRLAGAIIFGLFGWYLGGVSTPYFPESSPPSFWLPVCALISLFLGWVVCGARAGRGYNPALGVGLTVGALMGFCFVFALAFHQMIKNALRIRYDGPMDAIVDVFNLMLEKGLMFYDWTLIGTLLIGSVICAWIVEYFGKRFP